MLKQKQTANPTPIQKAIDQVLLEMDGVTADSDEFAAMTKQLIELSKVLPVKEPMFKPDTLLAVGGNLAGIVAILSYERLHVVASKALGFVLKSRI